MRKRIVLTLVGIFVIIAACGEGPPEEAIETYDGVAVLPFEGQSNTGDTASVRLAGVVEEELRMLLVDEDVPVISRTASHEYRSRNGLLEDMPLTIMHELKVPCLIQGGVTVNGEQISLTVQARGPSGDPMWSETWIHEHGARSEVEMAQDILDSLPIEECAAPAVLREATVPSE